MEGRVALADTVSFTLGYEGRTLEALVRELVGHGVDRVVDVRELPLSRRKGFSKTPLREALGEAGIEYVHLRVAGNPHRAVKSDIARCLALYREHLAANPEALDQVHDALVGRRAALLCVESDCLLCHRSILVERLRERAPTWTVVHL